MYIIHEINIVGFWLYVMFFFEYQLLYWTFFIVDSTSRKKLFISQLVLQQVEKWIAWGEASSE